MKVEFGNKRGDTPLNSTNYIISTLILALSITFIYILIPHVKKFKLKEIVLLALFNWLLLFLKIENGFMKLFIISLGMFLFFFLMIKDYYESIISTTLILFCFIANYSLLCLISLSLFGIGYKGICNDLIYCIIFNLFLVLFSYLMIKIIKSFFYRLKIELREVVKNLGTISLLLSTLLSLTGVVDHVIADHNSYNLYNIFFITAFILFCAFVNIVVINANSKCVSEKIISKTKEEQLNNLALYTKGIEELLIELKTVKHNNINTLLSIEGYIHNNDMESLRKYYYQEIIPEMHILKTIDPSIVMLKNLDNMPELKGLIACKYLNSKSNNIKMNIDIFEKINSIPMNKLHLCKIIGILLDNAIEAASESIEKTIEFAIIKFDTYTSFIIINSTRDLPDISQIFNVGYSTKGEGRGLGLPTIKALIDNKYPNCLMNFLLEGNNFTFELHIEDN